MDCRHMGGKLEYGTECKILHKKCIFLAPDESRCSEKDGGIINYLKAIGTYEKVKGDPKYTSESVDKKLNTLWKREFGEDFSTKEKVDVHTLKTWPEPFQAVWEGKKPWEYRNNDRNFKVGDVVVLQEWYKATKQLSGREITAEIVYMLKEGFGLAEGYVILSLANICRGAV